MSKGRKWDGSLLLWQRPIFNRWSRAALVTPRHRSERHTVCAALKCQVSPTKQVTRIINLTASLTAKATPHHGTKRTPRHQRARNSGHFNTPRYVLDGIPSNYGSEGWAFESSRARHRLDGLSRHTFNVSFLHPAAVHRNRALSACLGLVCPRGHTRAHELCGGKCENGSIAAGT